MLPFDNNDISDNDEYCMGIISDIIIENQTAQHISFNQIIFKNVTFKQVSFKHIDLTDVRFENCDMSNIEIGRASCRERVS